MIEPAVVTEAALGTGLVTEVGVIDDAGADDGVVAVEEQATRATTAPTPVATTQAARR
jgi:hypothetical protein